MDAMDVVLRAYHDSLHKNDKKPAPAPAHIPTKWEKTTLEQYEKMGLQERTKMRLQDRDTYNRLTREAYAARNIRK